MVFVQESFQASSSQVQRSPLVGLEVGAEASILGVVLSQAGCPRIDSAGVSGIIPAKLVSFIPQKESPISGLVEGEEGMVNMVLAGGEAFFGGFA